MERLKPCPFCGGEAKLEWTISYFAERREADFYICSCEKCGCERGPYNGVDEAIKAWNTRAE